MTEERQAPDPRAAGFSLLEVVISLAVVSVGLLGFSKAILDSMVLNQMSDFWFEKLGHIVPNHLTGVAPESVVAPDEVEQVRGRAVVAKRLKPIMVEAVVRGYIIGSGWKDYQASGSICGIQLPPG